MIIFCLEPLAGNLEKQENLYKQLIEIPKGSQNCKIILKWALNSSSLQDVKVWLLSLLPYIGKYQLAVIECWFMLFVIIRFESFKLFMLILGVRCSFFLLCLFKSLILKQGTIESVYIQFRSSATLRFGVLMARIIPALLPLIPNIKSRTVSYVLRINSWWSSTLWCHSH
jgi:hypothetical protein